MTTEIEARLRAIGEYIGDETVEEKLVHELASALRTAVEGFEKIKTDAYCDICESHCDDSDEALQKISEQLGGGGGE